MATLTLQETGFTGLNFAYEAAATADAFANDGKTVLVFLNSNASARTLTLAGNAFSKPGFGDISAADAGETVTLPGSGTNGGRCVVGPFPPDRFNNSSGQAGYTLDAATGLSVAVIRLRGYA